MQKQLNIIGYVTVFFLLKMTNVVTKSYNLLINLFTLCDEMARNDELCF